MLRLRLGPRALGGGDRFLFLTFAFCPLTFDFLVAPSAHLSADTAQLRTNPLRFSRLRLRLRLTHPVPLQTVLFSLAPRPLRQGRMAEGILPQRLAMRPDLGVSVRFLPLLVLVRLMPSRAA